MTAPLATMFFAHTDCGCRKEPLVGARYRRRSRDPLTGEDRGWRFYTVAAVEPFRQDRILCRRLTLAEDGGWVGHHQVQHLFEGGYEALDNVVTLPWMEEKTDGDR